MNFDTNTWIIVGVVAVLTYLWSAGRRDSNFRANAPAVMTSVGILGTFLGIFLALIPLDFSTGQMNDSIEALLAGMQLAFVTSLLGLGFSIGFRLFEKWSPPKSSRPPTDPAQDALLGRLDAIARAIGGDGDTSLLTQFQKLRDEGREDSKRLDSIRAAIAGEGDSSLVTQIQKLRDENLDGFRRLDGLAQTIEESLVRNLEILIKDIRVVIERQLGDSLRKLIAQIEKALIEQFGKTFVEFNAATQALKKWQEDHRDQVEQLTAAFETTAQGITRIAEECRSIPVTMEALGVTVETARQSVQVLNQQLADFATLGEQARTAFPTIKQHLDRIGDDLSASARAFDGLEATLTRTFEAHGQQVEAIAGRLERTLETAKQEVSENVKTTVRTSLDTLDQQVRRLVTEWGGHMVVLAQRMAEEIESPPRRIR